MKLGFYKHDNNTDVAIKIIGCTRRANGYTIICHWVNIINPDNPYYAEKYDVCFITDEQVPNWKEYNVRSF